MEELLTTAPTFLQRFRGAGGWLFGLTLAIAMLLWHWQLFLATMTGLGVMVLVYFTQKTNWKIIWLRFQKFWNSSNRAVALAIFSGGLGTASSYLAVAIWVELDSHWLAFGFILQNLFTLVILILLLWQILARQNNREESKLYALLGDLTAPDPLKRLMAVRLLAKVSNNRPSERDRQLITDSLRLMLGREPEPIVRDTVLDAFGSLNHTPVLNKQVPPLSIPLDLKQSPARVHRQIS